MGYSAVEPTIMCLNEMMEKRVRKVKIVLRLYYTDVWGWGIIA